MQKKSFAAISTALAAVLMFSTGSPAYAADAADGSKMTVQQMRQPIPLSLNKVSKVLGQPDVYVYDCNPEDIYEKSHLKGSIHANKAVMLVYWLIIFVLGILHKLLEKKCANMY